MNTSDGNAVLVNALSSSLRSTLNGLDSIPGLIRQVLEEGSWRNFTTPRGEQVSHSNFESFLTEAPSRGLGKTVNELVRILEGDIESLALLADALGTSATRLPASDQGKVDPITKDAQDFGTYARNGGWIFGLMVARSVRPNKRSGRSRSGKDATATETSDTYSNEKVSAGEFALKAGCSRERVMRFYRAWARAADAQVVQPAEDLVPGQVVELPDPEGWAEYFTMYEQSTDRRENIAQQAEASGTSYTEALKVTKHPSAMRTAILADAKTAEAARAALADRMQDDSDLRKSMAMTMAKSPEFRKDISTQTRRAEQVEYIRQAAELGKARTPGGQFIELTNEAKKEATEHLSKVNDLDIAEEEIEAAYGAVREIISSTIEADPEILTREQRSKFRKTLNSAVKNIESIDPGDLIVVADDELRASIAAVQKKINELADLLGHQQENHLRVI
ncbi:hypothetical protein [Actinomadura craniellae]|uniref:hypothetical protein n=1 Tax=Actinomadura craniellae TaxID=2231787 RepID=UPI0011BF62F2|nr:hypothetical protein [Actinomadura craniellae]